MFPEKMTESEGKEIHTFDWIISMIADGNDLFTPREIIHFLNEVNTIQEELIKYGHKVNDNKLYSKESLEQAIKGVAKIKFDQTLRAENPLISKLIVQNFKNANSKVYKKWISVKLNHQKESETDILCNELVRIGFLKYFDDNSYWIPYLYQIALK